MTRMNGRLLVIDDEVEERESRKQTFEAIGLTVDTAESGEEAFQMLEAHKWDYKATLIDIDLPERNGIQVASDIFSWREKRGFNIAPEILCITGDPKYKTVDTLFELEKRRGIRCLLKGASEYPILAVQVAVRWIDFQRGQGPLVLIKKRAPGGLWDEKPTPPIRIATAAKGGAEVCGIWINQIPLQLGSTEAAVFEYIAWYSSRNIAISYEQLALEVSDYELRERTKKYMEVCVSRIKEALTAIHVNPDDMLVVLNGGKVQLHAWVEVQEDLVER